MTDRSAGISSPPERQIRLHTQENGRDAAPRPIPDSLFLTADGRRCTPYLIAAPSYTGRSGGVMGLFQLCHELRRHGVPAWIEPMEHPFLWKQELPQPLQGRLRKIPRRKLFVTSPYLDAPLITRDIKTFFAREGIEPIVLYPDIVRGNPLGARRVARYLLAPAGEFGGEKNFPATDSVWSYSRLIAGKTKNPGNILSVCVTDTTIYKPGAFPRKGACFFANKYDRIHGQKLLPLTAGAQRLGGTQAQMIETMQTSEICYVYENSAVSVEAALCGCNVVLVRTPYFHESWLHGEYGWAGVRWSNEDKPRESVEQALSNYRAMEKRFREEQLPHFIQETQKL